MMSATARRSHAWIEWLARQRAVFAAAWAARAELAGPRRLAHEAAFLPAALSLQETPVHPAPRRALWLIVALFSTALLWSLFGQVDIVAVAPGRIVPGDRSKTVQAFEAGVVRAIHVKDGDRVQAGQVLVELDATQAGADKLSVQEQMAATADELRRVDALLEALRIGAADAQAGSLDGRDALLQAEWADVAGRLARRDAEIARREAELATVRESVEKLGMTVPIARQREADYIAMRNEGAVAAHAAQDRMRERIEAERDLATQKARLAEAEAALHESRQARIAEAAAILRNLNERQGKARLDHAQLTQQGRKSQQRESLMRVLAPVAGVVQQRAIHTAGGVVTPAQALMVIVPEGGEVTALVEITNQDIGFVAQGQAVEVKLEPFPFTRYGTVAAVVHHVSADAVVDERRGALFNATLRFEQDGLQVEGRRVPLAAGMNVVAEIKTGRRRVIDYLLSPLRGTIGESGRER